MKIRIFSVAIATSLIMTALSAFSITASAEPESSHTHNFKYTASGDTITATCDNEGCDLTDSKVTMTIKAPENLFYDDTTVSHEATLENVDVFNDVTGRDFSQNDIVYFKGTNTTTDIRNGKPKGATYTAKIAANSTKNVFGSADTVASVSFRLGYKPATATYEQIGDFVGNSADDVASAWKITITPRIDTITNIGVRVNEKTSEEILDTPNITDGTVVVGVSVNLAAKDVEKVFAIVNDDSNVLAEKVD